MAYVALSKYLQKNVMKVLPFLNYEPLKLANERAARANSNSLWEVVLPNLHT